jgi:hypothetical protein
MNVEDLNRETEKNKREREMSDLLDEDSVLFEFNGRDFLCADAAFFNGRVVRVFVAD